MRAHSPAGFTLIEVLVALLVGSVVVLGARQLLEGLSLQTSRVARVAELTDAEANADRMLRAAVRRAGLAVDSAGRFTGTATDASFSSWCDVPGGWQERCDVRLHLDRTDDSVSLALDLGSDAGIVVAHALDAATLRYLASAADGGRWVDRWAPAIVPPLAIGVIARVAPGARADTLVLPLGEVR